MCRLADSGSSSNESKVQKNNVLVTSANEPSTIHAITSN